MPPSAIRHHYLATIALSASLGLSPVLAAETDVRGALERAAVELNLGRPAAALHALESVAEIEPDNPWLAYYEGAAQLQLDRPYDAMASLDRAWSLTDAAPERDEALRRRIESLRTEARRRVLQVSLRLGIAYDTNVAFLGEGAVTADLVTGDDDWLFESRFSVAFAPIMERGTSLTFGASAVNSWHFRIDEYDVQEYASFVQYARSLGPRTEALLGLRAFSVLLGNQSYVNGAAGTLGLRYEWPNSDESVRLLDSTIEAGAEFRDFRFPVDDELDQDGWVSWTGFVQRFVVAQEDRPDAALTGRIGYAFSHFDTDGSEYDRNAHRILFGFDMPLMNPHRPNEYLLLPDKPLWMEFTYDWEFARHRNDSVFTRRDEARRDRTNTFGLTLSQLLIDKPDRELVLHVIAGYTDANSNIRLADRTRPFTFDKYVFGLQFEWSW